MIPAAALVCFPYAGALGSCYGAWSSYAHESVRVYEMPQPEARSTHGIERELDEMVEAIVALPQEKVALFGHSLGAIMAAACAERLRDTHKPPEFLAVSAMAPPPRHRRFAQLLELDDDEFVNALRSAGSLPNLPTRVGAQRLVLRTFREHLEVLAACPEPSEASVTPIFAYGGVGDSAVSETDLYEWRHYTTSRFHVRSFAGGHMWLVDHAEELVKDLNALIARNGSRPRASEWHVANEVPNTNSHPL